MQVNGGLVRSFMYKDQLNPIAELDAFGEIVSVFVGTVNNLVGQPVIIMGITLIIYVAVSLLIALFMNWYNARLALSRA